MKIRLKLIFFLNNINASLLTSLFAVSDVVGNLSCSGLTWDTIQLSWEIPENPNGQLLFYNIIVQGGMETYTLQSTSPEYTLTGLSPNQEYALSVAAVNSAGPGDQENCSASTLSESGSQIFRDLYCSILHI